MPSTKKSSETPGRPRRRARSLENRENQLIRMAYDLAEKRLADETASAQEIVHFLRMGAAKSQLEKQKLEMETALLQSKKEAVDSSKRSDERYQEAIDAFRSYSGSVDDVPEDL